MVRDGSFMEIPWSKIRVGDVLKVARNHPVPADCVFLGSYTAEGNQPDTCYVQTAQLDGETNLKLKAAVRQAAEHFTSDQACVAFRGCIKCEAPNAAFDKFAGTLHMQGHHSAAVPLEADNLLLRGCVLRNVDFAYALVTYTGRETKVRVRQTTRTSKTAQVETQLNSFILCLITLLISLCLVGTIGIVQHTRERVAGQWWFGERRGEVGATTGVLQFFTFFLLNAAFIPVSLYVSVRLARTLQVLFMEADELMVHEDEEQLRLSDGVEGRYPFKVRCMELNDELGQITHIFSDKTGTLTLNYMEWRKLLVRGVAYGLGMTQIGIDRLRRAGQDVAHLEGAIQAEKLRGRERGAQLPHVNFEDGSEDGSGRTVGRDSKDPSDGAQGSAIHNLLLHLALNHTVLPEVVRDKAGNAIGSKLSASSPDEEAFCYAAEALGYKFVSRTQEGLCLRIRHSTLSMPFVRSPVTFAQDVKSKSSRLLQGVKMNSDPAAGGGGKAAAAAGGVDVPFGVLHVLAYTQERKCMSVVVEHPAVDPEGHPCVVGGEAPIGERGHIYIYCKGADSAILPKCLPPRDAGEEAVLARTKATLGDWGNDGLRTLVFACRRVPRKEYEAWAVRYAAAVQDLAQLKLKKDKRPNAIDDLQVELETGLELQGATANEDKLQPEVPETLNLLAKAGIKLWMVTGDKQETAVNIGFATKLLEVSQRQIVVTMESAGGVGAAMKRLRIAAKRIKAEKVTDAEWAGGEGRGGPAGLGMAGAVMSWVNSRLLAAEAARGVTPTEGHSKEGASSVGGATPKSPRATFDIVVDIPPSRRSLQPGAAAVQPQPSTGQGASHDFDSDEDEEKIAGGEEASEAAIGAAIPQADAAGALPGTPLSPKSPGTRESQGLLAGGTSSGGGAMRAIDMGSINSSSTVSVQNPAHHSILNPFSEGARSLGSSHSTPGSAAPAAGAGVAEPHKPASRRPFALVIDEHCLDCALGNTRAKAYLLYVAVNCDAVIACRARPDQKARLVRLIRQGLPSARTLAVGDGANDVDMIGAAHVGVGIAGAEGVQAANASDFSIGRFRFLQRLLLVHGRWNYSRMARVVLYMFWKNIFFVLCQFLYQINWNGFSGQKWYVEYAAQAFNIVFTGAAPLAMGVLDRDLDAAWVLRYPKLYDFGRLAQGLSLPIFLSWACDSIFCAVVVFLLTVYGFRYPDAAFSPGLAGGTPFIFTMGTVAYSSIVVVTNLRVAAEVFHHGRVFQAVTALSVLLWVPSCFILDALKQDGMKGGMQYIFGSWNFWLLTLLTSGLLGLKLLLWKNVKRYFYPQLRHFVQECAALGISTRSVDSYTECADLARRLGKSVEEVAGAQRAATLAAEALGSSSVLLPLGSPAVAKGGGGGAMRLEHFSASPLRVACGTSDPNEGGYSALREGPQGGGAALPPFPMDSSGSAGGGGGGGGAVGGVGASPSTLATPLSKTILEGALRPRETPGDANFDLEKAAEADMDSPSTPTVGRGGGQLGFRPSGLSAQAEKVALADFKAQVSASVQRISSAPSNNGTIQ